MPNLHPVSFLSEALGRKIKLRVTAATLRTVEHNGGIDSYLRGTSSRKLTELGVKLKREVTKAAVSQDEKKAA